MKNTDTKITRKRAIDAFIDESFDLIEKLENDRVGRRMQKEFTREGAVDEAHQWYDAIASERGAEGDDNAACVVTEAEAREAAWYSLNAWKDRVDEGFECGRLSE